MFKVFEMFRGGCRADLHRKTMRGVSFFSSGLSAFSQLQVPFARNPVTAESRVRNPPRPLSGAEMSMRQSHVMIGLHKSLDCWCCDSWLGRQESERARERARDILEFRGRLGSRPAVIGTVVWAGQKGQQSSPL